MVHSLSTRSLTVLKIQRGNGARTFQGKNMALILDIKVVPSSGRQLCGLDKSGSLKCYLKSPPERGLANEELIGFLSKSLRIPKSEITIIAGATGRKKMIRVQRDLTMSEIMKLLGIEVQQTLWKK